MSAAAQLGAILGDDEAAWIAAELRQTGLAHKAAKRAYAAHQFTVKRLLIALVAEQGGAARACAVLEGIAAVPRVGRPDVVWTAPSGSGIEGRTTLAVAQLVNEATTTVYAATYSATWGSAYVKTL